MSFFAKKSLGQNFLQSTHVVDKMILAGRIKPNEAVLEIGPGKGILTEGLLSTGARVVAVEKDDRAIPFLQEKFTAQIANGQLTLVHGDILLFDTAKFAELTLTKQGTSGEYILVANIPYYITGELFRKFLEGADGTPSPKRIVIMVQKEVAERVVSREKGREGKGSILSISVKMFGKPKIVAVVPAGNFRPIPNVDSAILLIDEIVNPPIDTGLFFKILKAGFAHKRKVLIKNLAAVPELTVEKDTLNNLWKTCDLDKNVRAEDISLETWKNLLKNTVHRPDSLL